MSDESDAANDAVNQAIDALHARIAAADPKAALKLALRLDEHLMDHVPPEVMARALIYSVEAFVQEAGAALGTTEVVAAAMAQLMLTELEPLFGLPRTEGAHR